MINLYRGVSPYFNKVFTFIVFFVERWTDKFNKLFSILQALVLNRIGPKEGKWE